MPSSDQKVLNFKKNISVICLIYYLDPDKVIHVTGDLGIIIVISHDYISCMYSQELDWNIQWLCTWWCKNNKSYHINIPFICSLNSFLCSILGASIYKSLSLKIFKVSHQSLVIRLVLNERTCVEPKGSTWTQNKAALYTRNMWISGLTN